MTIPTQRIQMVAGTPIEVGSRRLLPSVMVSTLRGGAAGPAGLRVVRLRPVSLVVDGPDGARWLPIPNALAETLAPFLVASVGVAALSIVLMVLIRLMRGR
ncbi:MAG TPA: hypothetical protein PKH77_14535 [Anaerolineae bacterium]|nr:hypothetical protein [Anaerolineae bacterium]